MRQKEKLKERTN